VKLHGHKTAVICNEIDLSYQELNEKVNQLAHFLIQDKNVVSSERIGVYVERTPLMIISLLAIMKSGAAWVAINQDFPDERKKRIVEDAGLKLVITDTFDQVDFTTPGVQILDYKGELRSISKQPQTNPGINLEIKKSAFVIYTSGSTGQPKGMSITHHSMMDYILTFLDHFSVKPEDCVVQQAALSFDISVEEIFSAMISGASLLIMPDAGRDVEYIVQAIEKHKATILSTTPLVLNEINKYANQVASLRIIISGGELLLADHIDQLFGRTEIYNTYGPSESTVCASYHHVQSLDHASLIGKPIRNRKVYILNQNGNLCPVSVKGELYIAGAGLAEGYLNNVALTAERFVDNPFEKGSLMYRTGDLARWLPDGTIEYLGRVDHQVKIRGVRIELGEIEYQLTLAKQITEVVVIALEKEGEKYLVAYYVATESVDASALRVHLTDKLPDYMIPAYFVQLEEMPLTINGKLDRRSLPTPAYVQGDDYEAPSTELQRQLVAIWSETLKLDPDQISVSTSFFEMGGHSLKAAFLVNNIRKTLGVEVPLKEFFRYQRISELSDYVASSSAMSFVPLESTPVKSHYVLSDAQQRLYFLYQFDPSSVAYNLPQTVKLTGALDKEKLANAFERLIARHEVLRTTFEQREDGVYQQVLEDISFAIEYQSCEVTEVRNTIKSFVRPFDLSIGPLIRVGVVETGPEEHLLMTDLHHIITDGLSQSILVKEFMALYNEEVLPEIRLQYKDFAEWQQGELQQAAIAKQQAYWLETYAEPLQSLELPTDFTRPLISSQRGASVSLDLDESVTAGLKQIASDEGTTLYMVVLSLLNVLLSKLSNQEDVVVGTPTAGRSHPDVEEMVGMFVNTLPLRNYPKGTMTFQEFLSSVSKTTVSGFDNQSYPYEALVDELNLARDTSRNPLFDVMFSFLNSGEETNLQMSGLDVVAMDHDQETTKFDLTVVAVENNDRIHLGLQYATDLFREETIKKFANYLRQIIDAVLTDTAVRLSDVSVLSANERQQLLVDFNQTDTVFAEETFISLFNQQVGLTPDHIAVVLGDEELTYAQLSEKANEIAFLINEKIGGTGPQKVALLFHSSVEMIAGILGVLRAGCAFVPLSPGVPQKRNQYILSDSDASLLLVQEELEKQGEALFAADKILVISQARNERYKGQPLPEIAVIADDLINVIYTSGTTGQPKGVAVRHGGIANYLQWRVANYEMTDCDVALQLFSYHFDGFGCNLYPTLATGGKLVLMSDEDRMNGAHVAQVIAAQGVTNTLMTPGMFELILEAMPQSEMLSSLRVIALGGDKASSALLARSESLLPDLRISNEYGPTEASIAATHLDQLSSDTTQVIGRPLANTRIYILGSYDELLPAGTAGQLCIAGKGVAQGYVNNAQLTSEKFVDNPFEAGTLMYKTGDLARWLADGRIEYLGRVDNQVKIRGFRIELGEIEHQLSAHEQLHEVVVIAGEHAGGKHLVAYYVAAEAVEASTLRSFLASKMPDYMVPSYFIQLEQMPLTINGKLDRRALPALVYTDMAADVAPSTALEKQLAGTWATVLKLEEEQISANRSFFEMGGHSLNAAFLVNKLRKTLGIEVSLKDFFRYQTIAELAAYIETQASTDYERIGRTAEKPGYVLSAAQQRLYFLYEFDPTSIAYNLPQVVKLAGRLDKEQLESALTRLVERHEILRTTFEQTGEGVLQIVNETTDTAIVQHTCIDEEVSSVIQSFVRPFDLATGPLIRVGLITTASGEHLLMTDLHHIITDGVSQGILVDEFMSLYNNESLAELTLQYRDYAEWQQSAAQQEEVARQQAYWLDAFSEPTEVMELPTDYARPLVSSHGGGAYGFDLDRRTTEALRQIAKDQGATMYMVVLSLFNILLSKLSNQEDIVVGTPTAGRSHPDVEGMVGMFVNTLPLRNYPKGEMNFTELLSAVKETTLSGFENQSYPYEALVDELKLARDTSRNPLFDVMFSWQNFAESEQEMDGVQLTGYDSEFEVAKFDLVLAAVETGEGIHLGLKYATDLFKAETIERFAGYFQRVVEGVIADANTPLAALSIISEAERQYLLSHLDRTDVKFPANETVHQRFEQQVALYPRKIAVAHEKDSVTYQELSQRTNRLARVLINQGVKRGDLVALLTGRGIETIVGMLAILKAGGAYLPVDVTYPEERKQYMISDSGTQLLLTTQNHLADYGLPSVLIEESVNSANSDEALQAVNDPTDGCYVIYTSGTTGNPKGVMVNHRNVIRLLFNEHFQFDFDRSDTWTMF
ncbi:MAG: amino acid adenylation domain-containing protein, partial [Bacteroidota bacterium]